MMPPKCALNATVSGHIFPHLDRDVIPLALAGSRLTLNLGTIQPSTILTSLDLRHSVA